MAKFPGFIGPSYLGKSKYAASERCVNFYPQVIEDPGETKTKMVLYPTPNTGYLSGPATQFPGESRGLLELNGRLFGVNGNVFFEYILPFPGFPSGAWNQLNLDGSGNPIPIDGMGPVQMIANGVTTTAQQIFITTKTNKGYVWSVGGVFTPLSSVPDFQGGTGAAFLDDYFISIVPNTNGFQISSINDGTVWDAADVAYTQGQSDTLQALIADREYLWLMGGRRSEIWYVTGNIDFPFAIQPGAFMEVGIEAPDSLTQADNTIFWIGRDKRGGRIAWRANGFNPVRVSNYAVESAWAKYDTVQDCVSYSFVWEGHTFVRYIFPSAEKAWTYDCAMSQQLGYSVWHENNYTLVATNLPTASLERTHAYIQGIHVVGSGGAEGFPGTLYSFTTTTTMAVSPVIEFKLSRDGGSTWPVPWQQMPVGATGQYDVRAISGLLGAARDAVFWVRCTDYGEAVPNIDGTGGTVVIRERVCPHLFNENKWTFYKRLQIIAALGVGSGGPESFWALLDAVLNFDVGENA